MAEQAQSDAGDLDGLHDGPQDASQDPTKPPTQEQYTRLIRELNEPVKEIRDERAAITYTVTIRSSVNNNEKGNFLQ